MPTPKKKEKTETTTAQRDEMRRQIGLTGAAVDALINKVTTLEDTLKHRALIEERLEKRLAAQTDKVAEEVRLIGDEQDKQATRAKQIESSFGYYRRSSAKMRARSRAGVSYPGQNVGSFEL